MKNAGLKIPGTNVPLPAAQLIHSMFIGENKIGKILMEIRRKCFPSMKSLSMMTPSASPAPFQLINKPIPNKQKHDENAIYFFEKGSSHYPLTSFAPYPFYMDGKQWPTVNHYFQAQKFQSQPSIQDMIRQAETPFLALELAQDSNEVFSFIFVFIVEKLCIVVGFLEPVSRF